MKLGDKYSVDFEISEFIVNGFIDIFKDLNPLHTDSNFAKQKGFKEKVVHGNILNGFISYFVGECLPIREVILQAQKIKFHKPLYVNDKVNLSAEITGFFESVNSVEFKFIFRNQLNDKIAQGTIQIGFLK